VNVKASWLVVDAAVTEAGVTVMVPSPLVAAPAMITTADPV
jgi:hypothetical protein